MNSKKANRLFLSIILTDFAVIFLLIAGSRFFSIGILENLLVSQLAIFLPAVLSLLGSREKISAGDLGFKKIKISTVFLVILYTFLCMPLTNLVNAVSMLFVDNTVVSMSSDILEMPFWVMFLFMAVLGPFSEEFVFRGIIFNSYKKDGSTIGAVLLSALVFGFMHMNFNQAGYAIVLGIAMALVMTAAGSLWASVIMHITVNAQSVCMMYLTKYLYPENNDVLTAQTTGTELLAVIRVYAAAAVAATALAVCLLVFISVREGKKQELLDLGKKEKPVKCRITPSLIFTLLLTFGIMLSEMMIGG